MSAEKSFWQMLADVGREHDRQLTGLLNLTRDLRVELDRATRGDDEPRGFCCENRGLPVRLSLTDHSITPAVQDQEPPLNSVESVTLPSSPSAPSFAAPITQQDSNSNPMMLQTTPRTSPVDLAPQPAPPALPAVSVAKCPTDAPLVVKSAELKGQQATGDDAAGFVVNFNQPPDLDFPPAPPEPEHVAGVDSHPCIPSHASTISRTLSRTRSTLPELPGPVSSWLNQQLWFVTTTLFERLVATLIMLNTILMMVEAQYLGMQAGYITGFPGIDRPIAETLPWAERAFFIADRSFTIIFFIELVLRMLRFRCEFFMQPLNWIDILAVLGSVSQALMESVVMDPTVVRLLRVARPVRSIRFLKNKQIQGSFNILAKCLRASVVTLFWSLCLLMMIQCMLGMIAGQIAQDFVEDLSNPELGRHEVFRYYGTFSRCLVTMFEIHMANWAAPCRVVVNNVGELWGNALVFYRCVMGFALMSVISAVFVQQAMSVQQQDHELMILKKQKETERYNKKLKSLFESMDTDGDGQLCRREFDAVTRNHELKLFMESLDINPDDLQGLFDMLDTGDGFVSADEFLMGATRVRGQARNIDVAQLMVTVARLEHMMERKMEHMTELFAKITDLEGLLQGKGKCIEPPPRETTSWRIFGTNG